jgi:hypothetical protein
VTGLHVSQLPHLSAALAFRGRGGSGSCTLRSYALALDLRLAVITFGTFRAATDDEAAQIGPRASREPFIHCWVEVGDKVLAPTTIERTGGVLVPMGRESYYDVNGARDIRPVPRDAFEAIARRYRLSAALRHGSARAGSGDIAGALLEAAGVRYRLGEHRALLPIDRPSVGAA